MSREHYSETQKLQKVWFVILVIDMMVCGVIVFVITQHQGELAQLFIPLGILLTVTGFVIWVFTMTRLTIVIDTVGLHYRYPIFYPKQKTIVKEDIKKYSFRKYDAIFEFGGWGIKKSRKNGRCVTIHGDTALMLELKNGEKILIGTQNKDGVERAMKRIVRTDDLIN